MKSPESLWFDFTTARFWTCLHPFSTLLPLPRPIFNEKYNADRGAQETMGFHCLQRLLPIVIGLLTAAAAVVVGYISEVLGDFRTEKVNQLIAGSSTFRCGTERHLSTSDTYSRSVCMGISRLYLGYMYVYGYGKVQLKGLWDGVLAVGVF